MIIRLVKMRFKGHEIETFKTLFETRKSTIRSQPGCLHLKLWQDVHEQEVFYTYSHWESESDLNNYRDSLFFSDTWRATKALFAAPAEANSVVEM